MSYEITNAEIDIIHASDASQKIGYFITKIVEEQELCGIRNSDSFLSIGDEDGNECIPFWPHPQYAEKLIEGGWKDCFVEMLTLSDFLSHWLTGMHKDGVQVALFPDPQGEVILLDPDELKTRINEAMIELKSGQPAQGGCCGGNSQSSENESGGCCGGNNEQPEHEHVHEHRHGHDEGGGSDNSQNHEHKEGSGCCSEPDHSNN